MVSSLLLPRVPTTLSETQPRRSLNATKDSTPTCRKYDSPPLPVAGKLVQRETIAEVNKNVTYFILLLKKVGSARLR